MSANICLRELVKSIPPIRGDASVSDSMVVRQLRMSK